jgi:phage-related protein
VVSSDKPLVWLSGEITSPPFSMTARREAGFLLRMLQAGERLSLPQSRPMPEIGRRCHELRIRDEDDTWRIMYRLDRDAVVILDVLSKKSRRTPRAVISRCRARLRAYDASDAR